MTSDPLDGAPKGARELFGNLSKVCHGFNNDDIIVAALNIVINAVRQNRARRIDAAELYDGAVTRGRHVLLEEHYDAAGRRRGVYPFHQVITPEPVTNLSKIKGV